MKRKRYTATVTDGNGVTVGTAEAYAWNSAIRSSEAIVRDYARSHGEMYSGGRPDRTDDVYRRQWTGDKDRKYPRC